jgi:hypothetical protein
MNGMLKLVYSYPSPPTNSQQNREVFYPFEGIKATTTMQSLVPELSFDEKSNKLEFKNEFDSISTEEAHEKVLQDKVFGSAQLNKNRDKWIYIAKKKTPKIKSYFAGGAGKSVFLPDLGESYDGVSEVGVFIWDLKLKKVVPIDVKIEGNLSYIFSLPLFANDEGTKFVCNAHRKVEFGHGFNCYFNQPVEIVEVSVEELGKESMKATSKILTRKHEANVLASISPCYNYLMYFGGTSIIHAFYMDLVIMKKRAEGDSSALEEGYDQGWK